MDVCKNALAVTTLFLALISSATAQTTGSGKTTRYWDCCKPSCAWPMSSLTSPVKVCDASDQPLSDGSNTASGCTGGSAYMCSDQSPWAVSDSLAYGFAAVSASAPNCCSCYKLTFTSTAIAGKTMIVQATNTGSDVAATQFDLAIPGGGFGIFDACTTEWKATSAVWGAQYGGPSTNTCSQFPTTLQPGCGFRWDWMQGADNPDVDFETVECPAEIVAKSGCSLTGSTPAAAGSSSAGASSVIASSAVAAASDSGSSVPVPAVSSSTEPSGDTPAADSSSTAAAAENSSFSTATNPASGSTATATATAISSSSLAEATTAEPSGTANTDHKGRLHHPFRLKYGTISSSSGMPIAPFPTADTNKGADDKAVDEEEQDECEL